MSIFNKYYYRWPDKRDGLLIRFFAIYRYFERRKIQISSYYGELNFRNHVVNDITNEFFIELRKEAKTKIWELTRKGNVNDGESNEFWRRVNEVTFSTYSEW